MAVTAPAATPWDIARQCPAYVKVSAEPRIVELPAMQALEVSGIGAPGGPAFKDAIGALYSVAWTMKMTLKKGGGDYKVAPLEGIWWRADGADLLSAWGADREAWQWKLRILVPAFVTVADVAAAVTAAGRKKENPRTHDVVLAPVPAGLYCQAMHIGPYATEPGTFAKMAERIAAEGLSAKGPHHEVYLSDPNRAAPEKMKTILRLPV